MARLKEERDFDNKVAAATILDQTLEIVQTALIGSTFFDSKKDIEAVVTDCGAFIDAADSLMRSLDK